MKRLTNNLKRKEYKNVPKRTVNKDKTLPSEITVWLRKFNRHYKTALTELASK